MFSLVAKDKLFNKMSNNVLLIGISLQLVDNIE